MCPGMLKDTSVVQRSSSSDHIHCQGLVRHLHEPRGGMFRLKQVVKYSLIMSAFSLSLRAVMSPFVKQFDLV